jgi:hypothetical protein
LPCSDDHAGERPLVQLKFDAGTPSGRDAFKPRGIVIPQSQTEQILGEELLERAVKSNGTPNFQISNVDDRWRASGNKETIDDHPASEDFRHAILQTNGLRGR